jgi:hypothetical protein
MKTVQQASLSGIAVLSFCAMGMAQAPAGGPAGGPPPPRPNCANLRRDFSRRRKFYKQDHRRHASLDCVQYSRQREGFARRSGHRRSARWHTQWPWHRGPAWNSGLFWTWCWSGADPSLRIRVLCLGHEAGSTGQHHARGFAQSYGWPRRRQSRLVWSLPRAAPVMLGGSGEVVIRPPLLSFLAVFVQAES